MVPSPGVLSTFTVPPWAWTIHLAMARPSPEPPCELYLSSRLPQEGAWGDLNTPGLRSEAYDAACLQAVTALDEAAYWESHLLAQQLYAGLLPSLPLFARNRLLAHRPEVTGVILDATARTEFWNVETFDK